MFETLRRRRRVLEDIPFLHKECLAGLHVPYPLCPRVCVEAWGQEYDVQLGWIGKGKGFCRAFRCPVTGRMVERLYLWKGKLVSRHVLGLKYASQVRGRFEVLDVKADRLRYSLKDPLYRIPLEEGVPMPAKPKTMRWPVYWAKIERLEAIQRRFMSMA